MTHDPNQELNPNAVLTGVTLFFLFALTTVGYIVYASEAAQNAGTTAAAPAAEGGGPEAGDVKKGAKAKGAKAKGAKAKDPSKSKATH